MIIILTVFVLAVATALLFARHFQQKYPKWVKARLQNAVVVKLDSATAGSGVKQLPPLVQRYLEYTGTLKGHRINNFSACYNGHV